MHLHTNMEGLNDNRDDGDRTHGDGEEGLDADSAAGPNDESDRIFRSSLCGMFQEPQSSKTDACAVFCCGVYLWQRNQDLLLRVYRKEDESAGDAQSSSSQPLSSTTICSMISKRKLEISFILLVAVAIVIWSFDDPTTSHLFSAIGFFACELLIIGALWKFYQFQCARKRLRRQLAIAEYYRRQNVDISAEENEPELAAFLEQHQQEISGDGAHDLCGCANSDFGWIGGRRENSQETEVGNIDDDGENNHQNDFCFNAWRFLANLCCGMLCGCHLQLCGMCAIAQESRHLREVLPATTRPGLWQRDYITMQPWVEYYPSILRLRLSNQINCLPHFKALSRLSRQILVAAAAILLFVTLMFVFPIRFPKWQVLIVSKSVAIWAAENTPLFFRLYLIHQLTLHSPRFSSMEHYYNPLSSYFSFTGCGTDWISP